MRTIFNTRFNLPYTDIIDPRIPLITDSLIAGYDMLSNRDFSGRNNHFEWGGSFNSQGAILLNDANHIIQTPVIEQEEMTIITCWNITADSTNSSLFNNLDTSGTNYKGTRLSKLSTNNGQLDIAKGSAGTLSSMASGVSGGWTARAWSWNGSTVRNIQHSGTIGQSVALTARAKNTTRAFSMNGVAVGVPGGSITAGNTGTLGFVCFYAEYIAPEVAAERMNIIADIMAGRGVTVP
ncbi:hypothetical protein [Raoultella terrigena]|uniref:hypothetical protein n=1 Tax=Raoultella terrigena TaxID=577 RepID=UPI000F4BFD4F|nr:hypothetical protein [Raoultella terrigena]ROS02967.1 hypothetical protein EDF76_0970 [Raoultella terrigena]